MRKLFFFACAVMLFLVFSIIVGVSNSADDFPDEASTEAPLTPLMAKASLKASAEQPASDLSTESASTHPPLLADLPAAPLSPSTHAPEPSAHPPPPCVATPTPPVVRRVRTDPTVYRDLLHLPLINSDPSFKHLSKYRTGMRRAAVCFFGLARSNSQRVRSAFRDLVYGPLRPVSIRQVSSQPT